MEKTRVLIVLLSVTALVSFLIVISISTSIIDPDELGGGLDGVVRDQQEGAGGAGNRSCQTTWQSDLSNHAPSALSSDPASVSLLGFELEDEVAFNAHLDNVLVERNVGSSGHERVKKYLRKTLSSLGWAVEPEREFAMESPSPQGESKFSNVVAHFDPDAPRRVVIACHYDTKSGIPGFLGATDSAVPCAMMLHLAEALTPALERERSKGEGGVTVSMVFFDGEEALIEWTSSDSLYGSRHLAERWSQAAYRGDCQEGDATQLDRIQVMLLLDLLGGEKPTFANYQKFFDSSGENPHYEMMRRAEGAVAAEERKRGKKDVVEEMFTGVTTSNLPSDDHVPFVQAGLTRLLYLIPSSFPPVWHTSADDRGHLHAATIARINRLLRLWTAEILGMKAEDLREAFKGIRGEGN